MFDIIILIIADRREPYATLEEGIRSTWGKDLPDNIRLFYYYGGDRIELKGDRLYLPCEETLENIIYKTIDTFQFIIDRYDFKYIFRTNLSSYVDVELLNNLEKPEKLFYDGVIGDHDGIKFCSGAGFFLSRDLVSDIVNNYNKLDYSLPDDVCIGSYLINKGINPSGNIERFTVTDDSQQIPNGFYHYRVKDLSGNRLNDVARMKKIHEMKLCTKK